MRRYLGGYSDSSRSSFEIFASSFCLFFVLNFLTYIFIPTVFSLGTLFAQGSQELSPGLMEIETTRVLSRVCKDPSIQAQMRRAYEDTTYSSNNPETDNGIIRQQFIRHNRLQLRQELIKKIVEETVHIQVGLAPFTHILGLSLDLSHASSCKAISDSHPGVWGEYGNLLSQIRKISHSFRAFKDLGEEHFVRLMLGAVYEIELIRHLLLSDAWTRAPFTDENVSDRTEFPPLLPGHQKTGQMIHPQHRLAQLYTQFPYLKRPTTSVAGFAKESLSESLFKTVFLDRDLKTRINPVAEQLKRDLEPVFSRLLADLTTTNQPEVLSALMSTSPDIYSKSSLQKTYTLAHWQYFTHFELPRLLNQKIHPEIRLPKSAKNYLKQVIIQWHSEIDRLQVKTCEAKSNQFVENIPGLLTLYFLDQELSQKKLNHLDAYCNSHWGVTRNEFLQAGSSILAGVSFIGGVSVGGALPTVSSALINGSSALASTHYGLRASRRLERNQLRSAILNPSIRERNTDSAFAGLDLLLTPTSMVAASSLGNYMGQTGAWRYFVPFVGSDWNTRRSLAYGFELGMKVVFNANARLKRGINPLKDKGYYNSIMMAYLSQLASSRIIVAQSLSQFVNGIGVDLAVSYSVDNFVQNSIFALSGESIDPRIFDYTTKYTLSVGMVQKIPFQIIQTLSDWTIGERFPMSKNVVTVVMTVIRRFLLAQVGANAFLNYVYDPDMTFKGALAALKKEDFIPWKTKNETKLDLPLRNLDWEAFNALRQLALFYSAENEKGLDYYIELTGMGKKMIDRYISEPQESVASP